MSQTFNLQLATDTLSIEAQRLGVRPEQLERINVTVHASIILLLEPQLHLTYQIQISDAYLAAQLNWPEWTQDNVSFTDYLWQQTCLECFIAAGSSLDYIEINASPSGHYALYQFQNYREPSCLPPMPLLQKDGKTTARINWFDHSAKRRLTLRKVTPILNFSPSTVDTLTVASALPISTFMPCYRYERSFGVPLDQLPLSLFDSALFDNLSNKDSGNNTHTDIIYINQIHPCVILWFGESALYFAPAHASPPDFHQRSYWSNFDPKY